MGRDNYEETHRGGVIIVTSLIILTNIPSAYADNGLLLANDTADLISDVAPDQGSVITPVVTQTEVTTTNNDTNVTIPVNPDQTISVTDANSTLKGVSPVQISLPEEVDVNKARVANDGTVVYQASQKHGSHGAVQALSDGSVRIQTIMTSNQGPHEFTYDFENVSLSTHNDGTIRLTQVTSYPGFVVETVVGEIASAWAVDANGNPVSTHYEILDNGKLRQVIDTTAATAYPVVADPRVEWHWGSLSMVVYFDRGETLKLARGGEATAVLSGVGNGIIGAYVAGWALYAQWAYDDGVCFSATLHAVGTWWWPGRYSGGYC